MFRRAPAAARALLRSPEERVVAWARSGEQLVVASNRALWWPSDPARPIGWERIDKAVWTEGRLVVTEADVLDDLLLVDRAPVAVALAEPRDLPKIVRRRVEGSVASTRSVTVAGGHARLVSRRVPGQDGLSWWARLEPGTSDTAVVRGQLEDLIAELRAQQRALV